MKKLLFAALLAACVVLPLAAQELTGTGALTSVSLLNSRQYSEYFGFTGGNINIRSNYIWAASDTDIEKFGMLNFDASKMSREDTKILTDTPLEFALLSYYSPEVLSVRPEGADAILPANNPRAAGLKLGSAVLKELAELKFLDPSNTAAVGRYEGMIKFISDRNGVSRADIERHLKQGIAEVVREKFNEIDFYLQKFSGGFNATLSRNPQTKEYTLNYWGHYTGNVVRKISGRDINGLLAAMKNSPDFDTYGIEQVQAQAELIPAVIYGSWVEKKITNIDAVQLAADTIANFYISPTSANYDLLVGVFGLFNRKVEDPVAKAGLEAYRDAIVALNEPLGRKADTDGLNKGTVLARDARAYNPDYAIFATPYRK